MVLPFLSNIQKHSKQKSMNYIIIQFLMFKTSHPSFKNHRQTDRHSLPQSKSSFFQKSFTSTIHGGLINFSFKARGAMSSIGQIVSTEKKQSEIYIIGKKINNESQASKEIKDLIWYCYRYITNNPYVQTDLGWGCLIRVGQMAFSAALMKELKIRQPTEDQKKLRRFIITAFLDSGMEELQRYSLKKIVESAKIEFKPINYGNWFMPSQVCSTLATLHRKKAIAGGQKLKVLHFTNSIIYLSQIFEALQKSPCGCKIKDRIFCSKCQGIEPKFFRKKQMETFDSQSSSFISLGGKPHFQRTNQIKSRQNPFQASRIAQKEQNFFKKADSQNHALIFVTTKIGLSKVEENEYNQLLNYLKLPTSLGIVGGIPKRGYYIVGSIDKQLYYIDPHFVRESIDPKDLRKRINQFSFPDIRTIGRAELDPSMSFVFFIQNLQDLQELVKQIDSYKHNKYSILNHEWKQQFNEFVYEDAQSESGYNDEEESVYDELSMSRVYDI